jgi:hypothetical protein
MGAHGLICKPSHFLKLNRGLVESFFLIIILFPPFQIISHFNFIGMSKHFKFDRIYIIKQYLSYQISILTFFINYIFIVYLLDVVNLYNF